MNDREDIIGGYEAPGKAIVLGEHFVVYGAPALAIPLSGESIRVEVLRAEGEDQPIELDRSFPDMTRSSRVVEDALRRVGVSGVGWKVRVSSSLPLGSGLGSSAAFCTALVGALAQAGQVWITAARHQQIVHGLERFYHGRPSGVDGAVAVTAAPVSFDHGLVTHPRPAEQLTFVLASDGEPRNTGQLVAQVGDLCESEPEVFDARVERARELCEAGIECFCQGRSAELGRLMNDNHGLLQELGVSTPGLDRLVAVARRVGARGAKLTGAGGGGFVIALVDDADRERIAEALYDEEAAQVLTTEVAP